MDWTNDRKAGCRCGAHTAKAGDKELAKLPLDGGADPRQPSHLRVELFTSPCISEVALALSSLATTSVCPKYKAAANGVAPFCMMVKL